MRVKQLFVDAYHCSGQLDDAKLLMKVMTDSVEAVGARIVNSCETNYQPHGVTNVLVLAESHCVVSTWPEYKYAAIDILLCNDTMDPMDVWVLLRDFLKPEEEEAQNFVRQLTPPGMRSKS